MMTAAQGALSLEQKLIQSRGRTMSDSLQTLEDKFLAARLADLAGTIEGALIADRCDSKRRRLSTKSSDRQVSFATAPETDTNPTATKHRPKRRPIIDPTTI